MTDVELVHREGFNAGVDAALRVIAAYQADAKGFGSQSSDAVAVASVIAARVRAMVLKLQEGT